MPKRSSSVVGREFGNGVRVAIERTGLTQRRLAELLGWHEAKISDLLAGEGGGDKEEVIALLAYCRTKAEERDHLVALFMESGEKGWIQFPDDGVPDQVHTLINEEKAANEIIAWSMVLVPGLLQILDYAHSVTEASTLVEKADRPKVVEAKAARAEIIERSRTFSFYVHEQALWLPVGGLEVWCEQLAHLLRLSVRPYITIRVVPRGIGAHAGRQTVPALCFWRPPLPPVVDLYEGLFRPPQVDSGRKSPSSTTRTG